MEVNHDLLTMLYMGLKSLETFLWIESHFLNLIYKVGSF